MINPEPKAKLHRLNTIDYRLEFTNRLSGGTINMQNEPNLESNAQSAKRVTSHDLHKTNPISKTSTIVHRKYAKRTQSQLARDEIPHFGELSRAAKRDD